MTPPFISDIIELLDATEKGRVAFLDSSVLDAHEEVKPHGIILSFMKRFHIMKCFQEAGIKKDKGYALKDVVVFLIGLVFTNKTFYGLMKICNFNKPFDKMIICLAQEALPPAG